MKSSNNMDLILKKLKKHEFGHIFYVVRKILQKPPSETFLLAPKMFMKVVQDDGFVSSYVCSYSGINIWCIYDHGKVFRINGKIFFWNLTKAPLLPSFCWKLFHSLWKLFHGHKYTKYLSWSKNKHRRTQIHHPEPLSWTFSGDKEIFWRGGFCKIFLTT